MEPPERPDDSVRKFLLIIASDGIASTGTSLRNLCQIKQWWEEKRMAWSVSWWRNCMLHQTAVLSVGQQWVVWNSDILDLYYHICIYVCIYIYIPIINSRDSYQYLNQQKYILINYPQSPWDAAQSRHVRLGRVCVAHRFCAPWTTRWLGWESHLVLCGFFWNDMGVR